MKILFPTPISTRSTISISVIIKVKVIQRRKSIRKEIKITDLPISNELRSTIQHRRRIKIQNNLNIIDL
jgi:hypothetical protein